MFFSFTTSGYLITSGNIDLVDGVYAIGENKVTLKCKGTALFRIAARDCEVSNFQIDMACAPAGSTAILIRTSVRVSLYIRIKKIRFYNCYCGIQDEVSSSNYVVDIVLFDLIFLLTKGRQLYFRRSRGFFTVREVKVDHTSNPSAVTWEGMKFEDFIGLELEKVDVVDPVSSLVTPAYQAAAVGIYIKGTTGAGRASVWLTRVLVDNTMGPGIYLENIMNLICNDVMAYQNLGQPVQIINVQRAQIVNLFVVGEKGLTGATGSSNGIIFNACTDLQVSNLISTDNSGAGVIVIDSADNSFTNVKVKNNNSFGWNELGASNRNVVMSGSMRDNGASLSQVGAASAFLNWINEIEYRASDVGAKTV